MTSRGRHGQDRANETRDLLGYLGAERRRLFDDATPERQEQLLAGERRGKVFAAWNAVCQGTREGSHVTGLHYIPESNTLVVYLDSPAWTQEMTMLREIVRARMAARGANVDAIVCKTNRLEGHAPAAAAARRAHAPKGKATAPTPAPRLVALTRAEEAELDSRVAAIEDPKLREALKSAWKANLEWKKGQTGQNGC